MIIGENTDNTGSANIILNGDDGDFSGGDYARIRHLGDTGNMELSNGGGDGTNDIILNPGGNVGIGKPPPEEKLDVDGNILIEDGEVFFKKSNNGV